MKIAISAPIAVAATLMAGRFQTPVKNQDEISKLEQELAQKEALSKQLLLMKEQLKKGENLHLELQPKVEGLIPDPNSIQQSRQELNALEQEYESLQLSIGELEKEAPVAHKTEKKAEEELPANPLVKPDLIKLGHALFRVGKYQEAINALKTRNDGDASLLTASCLEKLGKPEEALAMYKNVIEKFPNTSASKQAGKLFEYLSLRSKLGETKDYDRYISDLKTLLDNSEAKK